MAQPPTTGNRIASYPPRDADGRVATLPDLLGGVVFGIVTGTIILVAIDGIFALLGVGKFGTISGWLAGILVVWLFVEEFRAWKGVPARILVTILAGVVALIIGAFLGTNLGPLPAVFAGAIAVAVAGFIYAVLWFFGVRYLVSRFGEG